MMTASMTDTANMRNDTVERADNKGSQLAASVRRKVAFKSKRTAVKENMGKTPVERAILQRSVNGLVAEGRAASVSLGGALQAVAESSHCLFEDVTDKVKAEMGQAWKKMFF